MRIGIIGLGSIGKRHAANAREMGHVVVGCDPREVDIPITQVRTADTLVVFQPDAVMICTPANTHAHIARELLDLGYAGPLFCEKPLALSVEECAIFREWPHPTTMVGYNLRFHPVIRAWKEMGEWTEGAFTVRCDNSKYRNDIFELSHELDLACWFNVAPDTRDMHGASEYYLRRWMLRRDGARVEAAFYSPESIGTRMYVDELAHFLKMAKQNQPTITPFADGIRVVEICETAMKMAGAQA